ncbi:hypothetical protein SG1546 [Sodalis glossinidius str. 'morsitans']|uniref:Uncharacterized protein n=1 Tax=Sodalis glossinidius (strain morsitans) TaxID=343509 RepID=Q2NSQ4_SODGM|nr:FAD-dependent oxidoreductase [Sodalis glossinidius]BAE74821.1 hypothetical protein SG1546 [Sodalis glossinidius str. 'morsitans']
MTQSLQSRQPVAIDVLVVGAGSAGVAAAEEGARTLLVDASGSVGGTLAVQLLEHSAGFHNREGHQVVAGFAQRLVDYLEQNGASPGQKSSAREVHIAGWFRQSVPGCARAYVVAIGNQVGVRESRRITSTCFATGEAAAPGGGIAEAVITTRRHHQFGQRLSLMGHGAGQVTPDRQRQGEGLWLIHTLIVTPPAATRRHFQAGCRAGN